LGWSRIAGLGLLQGALYVCAAATSADWLGGGVTVVIAETVLYRVNLNDCTPHECGLPWLRISFLPLRGFLSFSLAQFSGNNSPLEKFRFKSLKLTVPIKSQSAQVRRLGTEIRWVLHSALQYAP
jgi:hypothetical protein